MLLDVVLAPAALRAVRFTGRARFVIGRVGFDGFVRCGGSAGGFAAAACSVGSDGSVGVVPIAVPAALGW